MFPMHTLLRGEGIQRTFKARSDLRNYDTCLTFQTLRASIDNWYNSAWIWITVRVVLNLRYHKANVSTVIVMNLL